MRLSFDKLSSVLDTLDDRLVNGELKTRDYNREYAETVTAAGWTMKEFEDAVDAGWSDDLLSREDSVKQAWQPKHSVS